MAGLTLDTGALIAFERNDRQMVAIVARAVRQRVNLAVPAGVVGGVAGRSPSGTPGAPPGLAPRGGRTSR